jgi:hypothetical protein
MMFVGGTETSVTPGKANPKPCERAMISAGAVRHGETPKKKRSTQRNVPTNGQKTVVGDMSPPDDDEGMGTCAFSFNHPKTERL